LLQDLYIKTGNSDIKFNGLVQNISELLYKKDEEISTELILQSGLYDFPEFWSFLPEVAESFPYSIENGSLEVLFITTYKKLTDFIDVPELDFQIDNLNGSVKGLLPWTEINNGHFRLSEKDSVVHLEFNEFDIKIAESQIKTDFSYYITPDDNDSMEFKTHLQHVNPSKIFYVEENDTVPEILNAEIDGDFTCKINLPPDSIHQIDKLYLYAEELYYYTKDDTSYVKTLDLSSKKISYQVDTEYDFLVTLSASNTIETSELKTPLLHMEHLRLMIEADRGVYTLIPLESQYYGKEEEGKLVIKPFEEPPAYHLDYSVKEFPIDEFLSTFYNDEIISGSVDLVLDLDFSGNDVESITKNMDGEISFNGRQLTLNGMNLDEFINNFRRSQRFNLVDLSAVMLAGPAGIMVTKGSDYAMIIAGNKGEKTTISQFASVWDIDKGKITIKDVAFATLENRIAAQGWIDMRSDSLDVTIAILDENGCSLINQNISGSGNDPVYSNVKIIQTLLAPVTKLLKNITLQDCDKFYEGIVEHPVKQKQ
jgi:hypothetical protein